MNTQEQLEQINSAISAIENGAQEYQIGSRRVRRADYAALCTERRRLKAELAQEVTGSTFVASFDRR